MLLSKHACSSANLRVPVGQLLNLRGMEAMMTVQKKWIVFAISLLTSITAWAQEFPKAELGFDYSYARFAPNAAGTKGHSLNGGGGSIVFNVNQYFGIKADLQG